MKNISFEVKDGEKIALLGLNGSGKSTLMLHMNGILLPSKGEVKFKNIDTRDKNIIEIRKGVGIVFQNPDDQLFMPTVKDDVAFGPRNMNIREEEVSLRVENALKATNTFDLANSSPLDLSGGQKKSVSIATILSMSPELIVMDEPTSGLDYEATENFKDIVRSFEQSYIISTHDIELAKELCERAIILDKGEIIYDGSIKEINYPPEK
ncbi:MAG: ABC transporter ATP-binding protein [Muribaculaceae bacterium]|nr:ABC transporter ATP-binding protein [Muribaculaceae bacterium]